MNHARYEELLALELYDELDDAERKPLDDHVAGCAACTRLRADLRAGLGRLRAPETVSARTDGPSEAWDAALRRAVASEDRSARHRTWWPVALAFAAGILATWAALRAPAEAPPVHVVAIASPWQRFHTEAPPPVGDGSGSLARFSSYLRR